ncbi:PqqD family peptide modification chaperone [Mycoplasma sp. P36-A1]|uniref:PqqD family peptide modification chaperone n=1 Tax=Mycoplasma sp. P36-A1 TaxID=3252900 RepID=UPI003C2D7409
MKKKQTIIKTNEDVLKVVYQHKDGLEYEVDENGIVTILIKQDHRIQKILRKIKVKIPEYSRMSLDKHASTVFQLIDGNRTVDDIAKVLKDQYGFKDEGLYENLLLFLNHIEANFKYIHKVN